MYVKAMLKMYVIPLQILMSVIKTMENVVKFAPTHLVVINVLVKMVTHWILMGLIALVRMYE